MIRVLTSETESDKKTKELKTTFINDDPRMPPRQRLKNLIAVYGPTAVVLHIGLSLTFLGITYLIVKFGFDASDLLEKYSKMDNKYMVILANGGTFGVAYALYKLAMPFRVLVTLGLTPGVARLLQRYGLIKRKF